MLDQKLSNKKNVFHFLCYEKCTISRWTRSDKNIFYSRVERCDVKIFNPLSKFLPFRPFTNFPRAKSLLSNLYWNVFRDASEPNSPTASCIFQFFALRFSSSKSTKLGWILYIDGINKNVLGLAAAIAREKKSHKDEIKFLQKIKAFRSYYFALFFSSVAKKNRIRNPSTSNLLFSAGFWKVSMFKCSQISIRFDLFPTLWETRAEIDKSRTEIKCEQKKM